MNTSDFVRIANEPPFLNEESEKWYRRGEALEKEAGNPEKTKDSFQAYLKGAKLGDMYCQRRVGSAYSSGKGCDQDLERALYWYNKASDNGDLLSKFYLASACIGGWGREEDWGRAIPLLLETAQQGLGTAQYYLATAYMNGQGTRVNHDLAFQWAQLAEKNEEPNEKSLPFILGKCFSHGLGTKTDRDKALSYLMRAWENGFETAAGEIGRLFLREGNSEEAMHWLLLAAEAGGDADVMYSLGLLFKYENGVPADKAQAASWFVQASELGHDKAQFELGCMLFFGDGIIADKHQALKWFVKAAEQGHSDAQFTLGTIYGAGKGIPENFKNAKKWLAAATERGDEGYEQMLKGLIMLGSPPEQGNKKRKGACYIATAIYGSYDCPEVWTLRRYRDDIISSTWQGRTVIKLYYYISPALVKVFGKVRFINHFGHSLLNRLVLRLHKNGTESTPYRDKF
ncbi:MAG: sel1 repeat family protein [Clostridiales bacterium]|nr:sel1 repeat family protein [Clostridiales bacterium]